MKRFFKTVLCFTLSALLLYTSSPIFARAEEDDDPLVGQTFGNVFMYDGDTSNVRNLFGKYVWVKVLGQTSGSFNPNTAPTYTMTPIDANKIRNCKNIDITSNDYKSATRLLGINEFTSLEKLNISNTNINRLTRQGTPELSIANNKNIEELKCSGCSKMDLISIEGCENLREFYPPDKFDGLFASNNNISTLDLSNCALYSSNYAFAISITQCKNLTSLKPPSNGPINYLICTNNALTYVDISSCAILTTSMTNLGSTAETAQQVSASYKTFDDGSRGFTLDLGGNTPTSMDTNWEYNNGKFTYSGTGNPPSSMYYTLTLKDKNSHQYTMIVHVNISGTLHNVDFAEDPDEPLSQKLFVGDKLHPVPQNPTKEAYDFKGWSDGTTTYKNLNDFVMPDKDVTLTAIWEVKSYNLTLNAGDDGGKFADGSNNKTYSIQFGSGAGTFEKPTREHYTLTGWKDSSVSPPKTYNANLDGFTMPVADNGLTLQAVWEINKHNIKFDANGGTFGNNITENILQNVAYNTAGTEIKENTDYKEPTKSGDIFNGWEDENGNDYKKDLSDFTMPDNETVLSAVWEQTKYTLSFDTNGGKTSTGETTIPSQSLAHDEHINTSIIPQITKEGYTLIGWKYDNITVTNLENFEMPSKDVTLTAQWTEATYNLNLYKESTDTQIFKTKQVKYNSSPNLTNEDLPTKEGYDLIGWSDGEQTYEDPQLTRFKMPYKDIRLNAVWKAKTYVLTFHGNGGIVEGNPYVAKDVDYDTTPTSIPQAIKDGATFGGWLDETSEKLYNAALVIDGTQEKFKMPNKNITLKAQWEIMHNLIFKDGDTILKTVPLAKGECPIGSSLPAIPVKDGYKFDSWTDGNNSYDGELRNKETGSYFAMPDETCTLTVKWTPKNYILAFDTNGGTPSSIDSQTVPCGQRPVALTVPVTKDGYNLTGWEYQLGGNTLTCKGDLSDFTMPAIGDEGSTLTLKAKWEAHVWELSFDTNGGKPSVISSQNVAYGNKPNPIPDDPTYEGYKFKGWSDGTNIYTNLNNFTMPDNKVTLTAQWQGLHKLDFVVNGANYKTQYLETGQHPLAVEPPKWDGYKFVGWKDLNGTVYQNITEYSMPDNDAELTAYWEQVYSLKVYLSDNDTTPYTTQQLCAGDKLSAKIDDPTQTGSTFKCWVYKSGGSGEVTLNENFTMPANDVSIVATWTVNDYTLSFNLNGGNGSIAPQTVKYGKHPQNVIAPTKEGYRFVGWQCGTDVYTDISSLVMPAQDTEVIAKWSVVYKLSLFLDDTSIAPYKTYDLAYGEAPSDGITPPTKPGYKFTHWKDKNGNTVNTTDFKMPSSDEKLIAYWEEGEYKLSFNLNGASDPESIDSQTLKYQEKILSDIPVPKKIGMAFAGWKESKYGKIVDLSTFTMPDYDLTLTAQFNSVEYTLVLNANNGNSEDNTTLKLKYNESPNSVSDPTREGYKFKGWQQGAKNIITDLSTFTMPANDVTLTAQWELSSYTLSFDTNGSEDEIKDQTVKFGSKPKAVTDPTLDGYEFKGWAYGGEIYKDINELKMPAEDTTVVAQWDAVYALSFNTKGGTPKTIDTVYLNEGETTTVTEPTKSGYVIEAWEDKDRNKTYSSNLSDFSMPPADTTLTAKYSTTVKATDSSSSASGSSHPSTGESTKISFKFVLSAACVSGLSLFMLNRTKGEEGRKLMELLKIRKKDIEEKK